MKFRVGQRLLIGKKETDACAPRLCEVKFLTKGGEKLIVQGVERVLSKIKISDYIITEVE